MDTRSSTERIRFDTESHFHGDFSIEYEPLDRTVRYDTESPRVQALMHRMMMRSFHAEWLAIFDDYREPHPSLTDSEIDEHTESFNFPEFKQGYCAIDQEEIMRGESCRRIKKVHQTLDSGDRTLGACTPSEH